MAVKNRQLAVSDEIRELLRKGVDDQNMWEVFEENFITYNSVMKDSRFSIPEYLNAIKYVSLKLMGYSNIDSYRITFPERYKKAVKGAEGKNCSVESYVGGFVSAYNRNMLVNKLMEQSLIPSYVLNAPLHQKAINELAGMISDGNLKGLTRVKACEVLLNYTKPPESIRYEMSISESGIDAISALKNTMEQLADKLKGGLESDVITLKQVAEGEFVPSNPDAQNVNG